MRPLGGYPRCPRQYGHDEPGDRPPRRAAQTKTLGAAERAAQQRTACRAHGAQQDTAAFVIVDARATTLTLPPRAARAPRGQRAAGRVPRNPPPHTPVIAALTTRGMGAALPISGAPDTAACAVSIAHCLVPSLVPGQIVVMATLRAHTRTRVRALMTAQGCARW